MSYKPTRDHRFEYVWDVMSFVEARQCGDCTFKNPHGDDGNGNAYNMCGEVESALLLDGIVPELDDRGEYGVVCTKYVDETLAEEAHPNQGRLF